MTKVIRGPIYQSMYNKPNNASCLIYIHATGIIIVGKIIHHPSLLFPPSTSLLSPNSYSTQNCLVLIDVYIFHLLHPLLPYLCPFLYLVCLRHRYAIPDRAVSPPPPHTFLSRPSPHVVFTSSSLARPPPPLSPLPIPPWHSDYIPRQIPDCCRFLGYQRRGGGGRGGGGGVSAVDFAFCALNDIIGIQSICWTGGRLEAVG